MPEDTPQGEEQHEMLSFTEAAERLVNDGIALNMTAEGLRRLARDPNSGWPIGPNDYRVVGKTRMLPYELLAPYMRERYGKRRGRGPDTKRRSQQPKQGDPMTEVAQQDNEPVNDWRVPLKYTREELADLLGKVEAGQYARMLIADYPDGGDTYVIAQEHGKSIRFNRLRVVDDPQYARDLAAVLLAWADREERR